MVRLLAMVAAAGLAITGQLLVHAEHTDVRGWSLLAVAALVAAAAAGQRAALPVAARPASAPDPIPAALRWGIGGLGVAAIAAATYLSATRQRPEAALLLWLAAPVLGSLALRGWQATPPRRAALAWSRREALWLGAVVLLAALARGLWIADLPRSYFGDEPRVAMYLHNAYTRGLPNYFSMGWNTWPVIGLSLQGLFAPLFGVHMWALRLSSALMGTLGVLAVYLLARELFTPRAGLFAALLFAVCRTAIDFSRLGITHAQILFFEPFAFFFLWRALNSGSGVAWLWAGVTTAWCLYSYNAGQLVPPLVFGWLLLGGLRPTRLRTHWRGAALLTAAFALTLFPYLYNFTDGFSFGPNWGQFTVMARNRQSLGRAMDAWQSTGIGAAWDIVQRQAVYTWLGFGVLPGANYPLGYRRGGMLDDISAALFVLGLAIALRRLRRGGEAFVGYWWLGTVVAGGIATIDPPSFVRLVGLLPALAIFAALPLEWLTRPGTGAANLAIGTVLALGLSAGAVWQNYRTYFIEFAAASGDAMSELARFMGSLPPDHRAVLLGVEHHLQFRGELFEIEYPNRWRDIADPAHFLPLREPLDAPLAIVLGPSQATLTDYLRDLYPGATVGEVSGSGGQPLFFRYVVVTPEQAAARSGLALAAQRGDGSPIELGRGDPFNAPPGVPADAVRLVWSGSVYWFNDRPMPVTIEAGQATTVRFGDAPPLTTSATLTGPPLTLRRGWQPLRIETALPYVRLAILIAGQRQTRWNLRPRSGREGLLASYVRGDGSTIELIDPQLNAFAVEDRYPAHSGPFIRMPFTATWRGALRIELPGEYAFEAQGSGPYVVRLDDRELLRAQPTMPEQPALSRAMRDLDPGLHPIEVAFDSRNKAHTTRRVFQLFWTPPGGTKVLVPPSNFVP